MKRLIVGVLSLLCFTTWISVPGYSRVASAAVSGKSFSIIYSSDERGAITPCG